MIKGKALIYLGEGDVLNQVFVNEYNDGKLGILMKNADLPIKPGLYTYLPVIEPEEADIHLVFKDFKSGIRVLDIWKELLITAQNTLNNKEKENNGTL